MKQLLFALVLLFFVLGCAKQEGEYTVNCQFPPLFFFGNNAKLLVTNENGDLLKKFDLPPGANSFSERFSVEGKELSERYDLHFLVSFDTSGQHLHLYSHLDVPNGASVYLAGDFSSFQSYRFLNLQVQGIQSFDSIRVVGDFSQTHNPNLHAATNVLTAIGYVLANHGAVIRLKANGESEFRHLYIPNGAIKDTVTVAWQDFEPESNLREIQAPSNFSAQIMQVTAISPDSKEFVTINENAVWQNGGQPFPLQFNQPNGLPDSWAYRIFVDDYLNSTFEKIFQPGEALAFEPANMSINSFTVNSRFVQVKTSGDIDLIRVELNEFPFNNSGYVIWHISGAPETFEGRKLPDISAYVPSWFTISSGWGSTRVGAMQFDKYDYPQVREGFPYKLSEPYSVARSGYKAVWKFY